MGKPKKESQIRIYWCRIIILVLALILIFECIHWGVNTLFLQQPAKTQQNSESTPTQQNTQKYNEPIKGNDGVYRIDNTIIVNKKYGLPKAYNPGENNEAASQIKQMLNAMKQQKLNVMLEYAGYRSYEVQGDLYNQYVLESGQTEADTFSARPGFSEHQTGLAFDILDLNGELLQSKNDEKAVQWVKTHAHEYGFIVRYLKDKESITGYIHEEWHVRYLGKELAQKVHDSTLSLEEYYNIEGGSYK